MGFKLNDELSVFENARAAWEAKKSVHLSQIEHNARVLGRKVLPGVDVDAIEFTYDVAMYPDVPTFVLDDEMLAYNHSRKQFALIEVCGGCAKAVAVEPL